MKATCSKCGFEMVDAAWGCPNCEALAEAENEQDEEGLSPSGMRLLLWLCAGFPAILYLLHILVPGL